MPISRKPTYQKDDPRSHLPDSAQRRLWSAHADADRIRKRALDTVECRFLADSEGHLDFRDYCASGAAAIELREANLEAALAVLRALVDEFKSLGKSSRELDQIIRDELDDVINSYGLTTIQRDLLWQELGLFRAGDDCQSSSAISEGASGTDAVTHTGEDTVRHPTTAAPEAHGRKGRRGPKADYGLALSVAEVVAKAAPAGDWRSKSKLDSVCEALDSAEIPIPSTWRKEKSCRYWADKTPDRETVIKVIEYRLKKAIEGREKNLAKTLS